MEEDPEDAEDDSKGAAERCKVCWSGVWKIISGIQPDEQLTGPYAERMQGGGIQLTARALQTDLLLRFWWRGKVDAGVLCSKFNWDKQYLGSIYYQERGNIRSGVVLEKDVTEDDKDVFRIRLDAISPDVFFLIFTVVGWESMSTFLKMNDMTARLCPDWETDEFWRWFKEDCYFNGNAYIYVALYRGPHGTWRVEPLKMAYMLKCLEDNDTQKAVAQCMHSLKTEFDWFMQDRLWKVMKEERSINEFGKVDHKPVYFLS